MSDIRLRALERQAEVSGADSDALTFVRELQRAGLLEDSDLRPSMQARILDALARQAATGSRDDILLYMKVLDAISGYPPSKVVYTHRSDLGAAISVALMGRGVDPEAVYRVMGRIDEVWENDVGPMLDELERECEVAETEIERDRRRRRGRGGRRAPTTSLATQRTASAEQAYQLARHGDPFPGVNIDRASPWRRDGDVWRRQVDIGDGQGWTSTAWVEVAFAPGEARVLRTTVTESNEFEQEGR